METKPVDKCTNLTELYGPNGERWTKGPMAMDENGRGCSIGSPTACKWCLIGGLCKVYGDHPDYAQFRDRLHQAVATFLPLAQARSLLQSQAIVTFNEKPTTTFGDIRNILKVAGL